jgi:hypothetical protein
MINIDNDILRLQNDLNQVIKLGNLEIKQNIKKTYLLAALKIAKPTGKIKFSNEKDFLI